MGPPRKKNKKDDDDDDPISPDIVVVQTQDAPPGGPPAGKPLPMTSYTSSIVIAPTPPTQIDDFNPPDRTDHPKIYPPPSGPPYWMSDAVFPPGSWVASTPTWTTSSRPTSLPAATDATASTTSSRVSDTSDTSSPTPAGYGNERPSWHGRESMKTGGMYAAAAITPVVVLAMVGAAVFLCMRKRKRQRAGSTVVQSKTEEMKLHARSPPVTQAYMASPSIESPRYTVTDTHPLSPPDPAHMHPIILGPISSGTNGAYFTGIDTSDVISMTSSNNIRPGPPNPFSDNDSLIEPPPPYRPRSTAPPSLTNSSRHSSLRNSTAPPATSRTHLIERSPFEDPFDDDAVSELSGPAAGHNDDTMSAVSDLSYQHEPVVNRSSL